MRLKAIYVMNNILSSSDNMAPLTVPCSAWRTHRSESLLRQQDCTLTGLTFVLLLPCGPDLYPVRLWMISAGLETAFTVTSSLILTPVQRIFQRLPIYRCTKSPFVRLPLFSGGFSFASLPLHYRNLCRFPFVYPRTVPTAGLRLLIRLLAAFFMQVTGFAS